MERTKSFSASEVFVDGFMVKQALFQDRKAKMPEGSSTTRLFKEGFPRLVSKGIEEFSETIRAFEYQDADQVNLEVSQLVYYLMVSIVMTGKGSVDKVIARFQNGRAKRVKLREEPGSEIQEFGTSLGKAFNTLMVDSSSTEDVEVQVADVFLKIDNMIVLKRKGSWEGVLAKL